MDFFALVKQAVPIVTTTTSAEPPEEPGEETLERWQGLLSTPRQAFKEPKAEKRIK